MKRFILCAIALLTAEVASAQLVQSSRGKEFYCMVMKYYGTPDQDGGFDFNHYIRVFLSSPIPATATVTVENPAFSQTVTIVPNVVSTVTLPYDVEVTEVELPTRKAIHIVADTDISAYVIYHKLYSTDSYMALPVTSLGNEYVAACYQSSVQFGDVSTAPEIGIVATEDNTEVTVTPSSSTQMGHPATVPFTINLNRGDAYLVYGNPTDYFCDLTGSFVNSTKPIAMFSGHERTQIPADSGRSRDCLVEQIPPNSTLGTSFITVPFAERSFPKYDYFRIVAPVDSTVITMDGAVRATIQAGQFYEFISTAPVQIQTTNPVLLAQYSLSATDFMGNYIGNATQDIPWDPALMIIPPTQQFLSEYTFANCEDVAFEHSYVNVVVPDAAVSTLLLDGMPVAVPFKPIPGSGYSYAQIEDAQGSHHIQTSQPFGIYVYGFGRADSYANTGGAAFKVLNGLLVTTNDVDYGGVSIDSCKDSVIVFGNQGKAPITVWSMWLADANAGDFTITGGKPPFTIAPGDSHFVHIRFCPGAVGYRGLTSVRFSSNAVERPTITLHGRGMQIGVESDLQVLDFRRVVVTKTRDSMFVLRNVSVRLANFDSLAITGVDRSMFSVVSPVGPFTLNAGAQQIVTVRFAPSSAGIKHAMIATAGNSGFYASVDLIGEGIIPAMAGEPDIVDYLFVKVFRSKDSLLTARSVGLAPVAVGAYSLTGPDAAEFVITSQGAGRTLPTGDTMQVGVRFVPQSPGLKHAELSWSAPGSSATTPIIALQGTGAYPGVSLAPRIVDFGRVKVNKRRDSVLTTTSIGPVPADVQGYFILPGPDAQDFIVSNQEAPRALASGETQLVTARFAPLSTGPKHAVLVVASDGRTPDTLADLYGNALPGLVSVATKTDTIRARVGDVITVPVRLLGKLDDADVGAYRILLGFDSTMLYPLGIHADSSWNALRFDPAMVYTPGRVAVQGISDSTLIGDGTLYYLDMQVLLGDAMETPLTFGDAQYVDRAGDSDVVATALHHGLFQLIGFCGDTNGLINVGRPLTLTAIAPNPLSGDAVVSFSVPALGPVHLALVDMLGRDAAVLAQGEHTPGQYAAILHASTLTQGYYTLVLQAGRFREIRRVEVVR